jgi:LPS O-antigen subunit length determinant protein (WzzB/FepE family)
MVTFGREDVFDEDTFEDALERQVDGEDADMRAMEKEYSLEMRKALEQQAREVRWLRGYGL